MEKITIQKWLQMVLTFTMENKPLSMTKEPKQFILQYHLLKYFKLLLVRQQIDSIFKFNFF